MNGSGRTYAATVHMFKDQRIEKANIAWTPTKDAYSPWQYEWNVFIDSKRINGLYRAVIKYEKL